jgi:hypothetical protein
MRRRATGVWRRAQPIRQSVAWMPVMHARGGAFAIMTSCLGFAPSDHIGL